MGKQIKKPTKHRDVNRNVRKRTADGVSSIDGITVLSMTPDTLEPVTSDSGNNNNHDVQNDIDIKLDFKDQDREESTQL